jgi:hypothetical protein
MTHVPARVPRLAFAAVLAACLPACDLEVEDLGDEGDESFRGFSLGNGLALGNGLSLSNGLALSNGFSLSNGLALNNGLSLSNGLALSNGLSLSNGFMTTSAGRDLVKYMVECALPAGDTLVKGTYTFNGLVGLAPEWKNGACGTDCQEWVSACLLARTNEKGLHVQIDMRAEHTSIGMSPTAGYSAQEGAFYGNLFSNPPVAYTCMGDDWIDANLQNRTCTDGAGCAMKNEVGWCDTACTTVSGAFPTCGTTMSTLLPGYKEYHNVITTYVPSYW